MKKLLKIIYSFIALASVSLAAIGAPSIHLEQLADQHIQPRLIADNEGNIHLIYFKRSDHERGRSLGTLQYKKYVSAGTRSKPELVSSIFRHSDAVGKASVAIDNRGGIHVVWLVSEPVGYWYTRRVDGRWQVPRNIVKGHLRGVETGANISVDHDRVSIVWHAGDMLSESSRQVYQILSADRGTNFGEEHAISDIKLGACACCSLTSTYLTDGSLIVAYRSAINDVGRHMQILNTTTSHIRNAGDWEINTCPVSSNSISGHWLVFETEGVIQKTHLLQSNSSTNVGTTNVGTHTGTRQKHPEIAISDDGYQLVSWGEGPGYFSGGKLKLQLFDDKGIAQQIPYPTDSDIAEFGASAAVFSSKFGFLVVY